MAKFKYTDKQVIRLLKGIHSGNINETDLPKDLYEAIKDYLTSGLIKGFGYSLEDVPKEQEPLLQDLYDNVTFFSAAKTFSFIKEASDLLVDEDGVVKPFSQFKTEAEATYGKYNEDWLEAEYRTTIGQSQAAQQWQTIEASKDILPFLTFTTAGNPCPECEPFEGLTAHVDDPIWDICTPLLHYNCECALLQSDDAEVTPQDDIDKLPTDDIPELFRNNPGKTGEIFTKDHPYFEVEEREEAFAKNNFDLPIEED